MRLQQAIIDFYATSFGTEYARSEVMATSGGKQAIFNAVVSLIEPGDEVLIPKPYWVTFPEVVVFARGTPVYIDTEESGFVLSAQQVERAITPKTKLIILNSPCNPSGRVIPAQEFEKIMALLADGESSSSQTSVTFALSTRQPKYLALPAWLRSCGIDCVLLVRFRRLMQ